MNPTGEPDCSGCSWVGTSELSVNGTFSAEPPSTDTSATDAGSAPVQVPMIVLDCAAPLGVTDVKVGTTLDVDWIRPK